MGTAALDMLRIEAGLVAAGHEFDDQTDPFEAGIGFVVPKNKGESFIGSDALARRRAAPQRRLVGLEIDTDEPVAHGDCVYIGRQKVGVIASGVRSPIRAQNIALCRMSVEYTASGTTAEIGKLDGQQKRLPARVVPIPHFDPSKERMKM